MSGYDTWLEAPYQDAYAAQERAEYIEAHTCCDCGEVGPHVLEPDEPCMVCAARGVLAVLDTQIAKTEVASVGH